MKQTYLFRKIGMWLSIGLTLVIWNIYSYYNYEGGIDDLLTLRPYMGTSVGYCYMALHMSIYPIICLITICVDTIDIEPAILLRKGRSKFLRLYHIIAVKNSVLFVSVFVAVLYILVYIRCDNEFWKAIDFIWPCLLFALAMALQYIIFSFIYLLLYIYMLNREKAMFVSSVFFVLIWAITRTFGVNLFSVQSRVMMEYYTSNGVDILQYIVEIAVYGAVAGIICLLGHIAFSRKDIL